jgi:heat shock protein beta
MKMIKVMSKKLVRKAIDMIKAMAEEEEDDDDDEYDEDDENKETAEGETKEDNEEGDDKEGDKKEEEDEEEDDNKYAMFWDHFGKSVKLGVIEDASNRNKLAKLLRFYSTNDTDTLTSLDEYISRMKPDQDTILYLPGDSKEAILKSPILSKYIKQGYEVLLMADPIDEFCTQHLSEYEKRKVKSIAKDDVNLIDGNDA